MERLARITGAGTGRRTVLSLALALVAALALPGIASADSLDAVGNEVLGETVPINTMWVIFAAILVLFMQAGFALLEIGFSRGKNVGTGIAKILVNLSIAAMCYYAVGFAFAFGTGSSEGDIIGTTGFFLQGFGDPQATFFPGGLGISDATIEAKWLFQFAFCAVSLAIVWGTTLERIKFSAYVIYAVVFSAFIYPIGSHWVFGGGWLQSNLGMQDFAGSTAVHLIGATGALAALLLLGPRKGKYGPDGKPRAIPGHSMPLVGLGVLILFIGWFGFNAGSTLGATDTRFAEVAVVTLLGACGGVLGAFIATIIRAAHDRHRHGRERHDRRPRRHHRSVGLRRGVDGTDHRRRRRPDRRVRDHRDRQEAGRPGRRAVGARSGRYLGHARVWHLHRAALRRVQRIRRPGPDLQRIVPPARSSRHSAS